MPILLILFLMCSSKLKLHNCSHTQVENNSLESKSIGEGPINLKFLLDFSYCFIIFIISTLDNQVFGLLDQVSGEKGLNISFINNSLLFTLLNGVFFNQHNSS